MLSKSEVKYIQTLFQKKFRDAENSYLIEGPKIVDEALNSSEVAVKKVFGLAEWVSQNELRYPGVEMIIVADHELKKISQLKTPNQVVALVEKTQAKAPPRPADHLVLVLDGIRDPGNLGTIIRIADWFGIPEIICSEDCADAFNGKVVQASMGSIFRVALHYEDLPTWIKRQQNIPVYGAVLDGTPLKKTGAIENGLLVIGNESQGIRPEVAALLTHKITIERKGQAESLNAAIAAGILLSHVK